MITGRPSIFFRSEYVFYNSENMWRDNEEGLSTKYFSVLVLEVYNRYSLK